MARHVVALGDSFTADGRYLEKVLAVLPPGSTGRKFGFVGKGAAFIHSKLPLALAEPTTDLIVLAGVNDLASGRRLKTTQEALQAIYRDARARGVRVVAVTVPPWAAYLKAPRFAANKSAILWKWRALNEWILANPDVTPVDTSGMGNAAGELNSAFASRDKLHPSAAGQARLGEEIQRQAFPVESVNV